ncbi:PHD finger protein 3 [Cololabis saira]|uniref:PHD finger protein 3 n=1 Tax=Cololabis saira TaxID=129043 RepID=UPI002AD393E5|nr:PHD finger protein 3 [Cololabis saira]
MDIVDTFNHLIPSDQLDDSLVIGQNLECEARNEFGTGLKLEESLKNMLSDKDPMFGCATSQLSEDPENEDPAFQIAGSANADSSSTSAGVTSGVKVAETTQVKQLVDEQKKRPGSLDYEFTSGQQRNMSTNTLIRGRPGRKPANRLSKSFVIEKGVKGVQLKEELTLGGRININDLDGGLWLKPTVVLRRLTVTIGGFKIELLPGPSYMDTDETNQSACYGDSFSYDPEIGVGIMSDAVVNVQNARPENVADMDVAEKSSADDTSLGLGPYVNPNDVQTSNGTLLENTCTKETKHDDQSSSEKLKHVSEEVHSVVQPRSSENNTAAVGDKIDGKEKHTEVKSPIKSKPGLTSIKSKDLVSCKRSNMIKEQNASQSKPSKIIQRGDLLKMKSPKDKKDASPLKRPAETPQSENATKVQKIHAAGDVKVTPKSPSTLSPVAKKVPSSGNRADHQGPVKQSNPHQSSKAEPVHQSHSGNSLKPPQEGGQEKFKLKKLEKMLQRHKSRNSRSISVEEPQLFIPDNAPAVKKETVEEQPANSESVWDGNNCCGLCKKHHNNMFMVGCGRCDDWFHGDCVGLDLAKVHEMEEEDQMYVCLKCCEEESKKVEPEPPTPAKLEIQEKTEAEDQKLPPKARPGSSQTLTSGGVRPFRDDPESSQSTGAKEGAHKTGVLSRYEMKSKSLASKKPVSVDAIRRSVRDSLREILSQRLKDSDLDVMVERASEVAKKTERELFHLFKDTDNKYKNKYRSLMFNLKDTKNNVLFKRVLKGEISPGNLIRMSPEELASKELAAWRQRENRHTIEMIEKEQREVERRPITKITHKGEIEIESQEPVKVPETVEIEPPPKVTEEIGEPPKTPEKKAEDTKMKDTTSLHKSHLFDLHCKICTGRMAPPVEEAPTKVVKVATTVIRRQSTKTEETKSTTAPAVDDDLHLTVLEESFRNSQSGFEARSDHLTGRDEENAFLSNLKPLWRGFIHMHSVAKFVTKAFPVSGILDNLTEDLPDSIQVGGRISPQMVWDYLEKIRATGTKEVCLVRFSPESEEDEISYTLLYAYFSSRRRFGVVSNNLKQVKDMYLVPLGATEKVPHQLAPFDGPGLENNRSNLLLGLIIRQRTKRDFLPVDINETGRFVPEIKPISLSTKATRQTEEEKEEKRFLTSLTSTHKKEADKPIDTTENELVTESPEEPSGTEEPSNQDSQKPLRFLPGVLLGWGGELPPLPDVGDKPGTTGHEAEKTQPAPKMDVSGGNLKSPTSAAARFIIKRKDAKPVKAAPELSSPAEVSASHNSSEKDAAPVVHHAPVTLRDKPPDVSTEAFLSSLSVAPSSVGTDSTAPTSKSSADPLSENEKGPTEGTCLSQSESHTASDPTNGSKPLLSGILKKSSVYSTVDEDKTVQLQNDKANLPDPSSPKPMLSSARKDLVLPFHQGYLQLSKARHKLEPKQTDIPSFLSKKNDPGVGQVGAVVTPEVYTPQAACNTEATPPSHETVTTPAVPGHDSAAPFSLQQQPQVPSSDDCSTAQPPNTFSPPNSDHQNSSVQGSQDSTTHALPEPQPQHPESQSEQSEQSPAPGKDCRRLDERYIDPWERPRNSEDRDHHGRHGHHRDHHHGKKSRHHDRERKHEHRDRSRHHGHSDDWHSERRKDRHHSDEYGSRHKDRHRHRRDSDYESDRRSSKDS